MGPTAPNANAIGSSGNSLGEGWLDTNSNALKVWDGSQWVEIAGGSSAEQVFIDFGLETGSVDYGVIASGVTSSETWGTLSYLTN